MKVFSGDGFFCGKQLRMIVATSSQKKAAALVGTTLSDIRDYWSLTGNEIACETALASPEVVFVETPTWSGNYVTLESLKVKK